MLALGGLGGPALAAERPQPQWLAAYASATEAAAAAKAGAHDHGGDDHVDTEHIFGFTMGSDIGEKGEVELEMETTGGFGKRHGTYWTISTLSLVKYTVTDSFRVAPGVIFGGSKVKNVPGFDDRQQASVEGAVFEMRYKVLDRAVAPFGLTLHVQPGWNRVDEATGLRVESYGSEFAALFDKEILPNRLWAAVNLWYGTGASRDIATSEWSHDSDVAIYGAVATRVAPNLILGGELRYLRAYEGMGLDRLKGEALYLGPTFSWHIARNAGLSGTVGFQVAGKAVGDAASLDLENFERMQAMLRFNLLF
ncbi:hypothetical protein PQJ75_23080 [Rhodoplanes sp. TEM]|uniref:Transporter n=1 Tax=Rhodoplanes tepidamans TaxID=200616 RepID=A0ABT5J886_RHOTP|nr:MULTISPECIES: hypothetical protein [Rhodoplanes]MDC7785834.1 hypothetical protein [Rhodoplanes tepidamans]MDC7986622.1 hypothetical protein [Rhodoplanes sp. TEM]MDQ0354601.1 hypothetical protein [Rhodoplanes tepidamans]